jgi:Tol biopolymer transport system component
MRRRNVGIKTLAATSLLIATAALRGQGVRAGDARRDLPPGGLQQYSATEPSLSRDGKSIAFTSDRTGRDEVYVMNADGSNVRRITSTTEPEHYPVWSPDGTRIAFFTAPGGKGAIYVMNADGSNRRLVAQTFTAADNPNRPTWSPDGKRLAFVAYVEGADQIMLANEDGSGLAKLPGALPNDGMPAWSPDGDRIAFVTRRSGNADIVASAVNGLGVQRITGDTLDEIHPTWSPDGKQIAFMAEVGERNPDLFIKTLESVDAPVNVSRNRDWEAYPEWSPADATKILEVSLRDGVLGLYLVDVRGQAPVWLTGPKR